MRPRDRRQAPEAAALRMVDPAWPAAAPVAQAAALSGRSPVSRVT